MKMILETCNGFHVKTDKNTQHSGERAGRGGLLSIRGWIRLLISGVRHENTEWQTQK